MKTILHLMAKDWRLLRSRLAVWIAVVAVKFVVGCHFVLRGTVTNAAADNLQMTVIALVVADAALSFLIAALLVQEDDVSRPVAFWRTRPISRRQLFGAKIGSALLMLVLPSILVAVPWWWVCGFEVGQMAFASMDVLLYQGSLLAIAFTAAALTPSIARCFIWAVVGIVVVLMLSNLGNVALGGPPQFLPWLQAPGLVLTVVAAVAVQFLRGRRDYALAALVVGSLASPFIGYQVIRLIWADPARPPEVRPELGSGVTLELTSARLRETLQAQRTHDRGGWIETKMLLRGLRGDLFPSVTSAFAQMETSGEPLGCVGAGSFDSSRRLNDWLTARRDAARGDVSLNIPYFLSLAEAQRLKDQPLVGEVTTHIDLLSAKRCFELPVLDRGWHAGGGHGLRILQAEKTGQKNEIRASILEGEPFSVLSMWRRARERNFGQISELSYVTRAAGRETRLRVQGQVIDLLVLGGVQLRTRKIDVGDLTNSTTENDHWQEGVSIAAVGFEKMASIRRDVKISP